MWSFKIKTYKNQDFRAKNAIINSFYSILIKSVSLIVGLLYVPLALKYLDNEKYGIWITINSIVIWASYFDLGLSIGLKNQLAKALAQKKNELAKELVSTTYFWLIIIFTFFIILFLYISPLIKWVKILNVNGIETKELVILLNIVFSFFCLKFILQNIIQILHAQEKVALGNLISPLGQVLSLFVLFILVHTNTRKDLILFGTVSSILPVLTMLIISIILFNTKLSFLAPSFYSIKIKHTKSILTIGYKFLIIQISILIITQMPNFLIANLMGPRYVPIFFISQKYFSLIYMLYTIIIQTYWPAFTVAWTQNDYYWIKKTLKRLIKLWIIFLVIGLIMLIISNTVYNYWTLGKVKIPFKISLLSMIYYLLICFGGIFTTLLASINKLNIQTIAYIIGSVVFIPLTYLFIKVFNFQISGILLAMILCSFNYFLAIIEVKDIFKKHNI